MKTLLEIQQDVRNLENSVTELSKNISEIYQSIDAVRAGEAKFVVDYKKIEKLSEKIPFSKHPLALRKIDSNVFVSYIKLLLNIMRMSYDLTATIKRLVLVQWLKKEFSLDKSLEDLLYLSYSETEETFEEDIQRIGEEIRMHFAVDLLMVANCTGEAEKPVYDYIAKLFTILNLSQQEVRIASLIAGTALMQSADGLNREEVLLLLDEAPAYSHYLNQKFIHTLIRSLRVVVLKVPKKEVRSFKWNGQKFPRMGYYKKMKLIATFERERKNPKKPNSYSKYIGESVSNEYPGFLFVYDDNGFYCAVSSHKSDKSRNIKEWLKSRL